MLKCKRSGDKLIVQLTGEIDHCCASGLRQEMEAILADPVIKRLHFDLSRVSMMDSSGIGLMIGRYKTIKQRNGEVTAEGASESVKRVYHLAGLHRIIPMKETGGYHEGKQDGTQVLHSS